MSLEPLHRLITRVVWRRRLQRSVHCGVWGIVVGLIPLLLALAAYRFGAGNQELIDISLLGVIVSTGTGAVAGILGRINPLHIAHEMDQAYSLNDRLSSALSLSNKLKTEQLPPSEIMFIHAQQSDALRFVPTIDVTKVAPWSWPSALFPCIALSLLALVLAMFPARVQLVPDIVFVVPHDSEHAYHSPILDDAAKLLERQQLDRLMKEALAVDLAPNLIEAIQQIDQLLTDVENQQLSEHEYLERLNEVFDRYVLTKKQREAYFAQIAQGASQSIQRDHELLDDVPDARELLGALKDNDASTALGLMEDILQKMSSQPLSADDIERYAGLFESLANNINLGDNEALAHALEKHREALASISEALPQSLQNESLQRQLESLDTRRRSSSPDPSSAAQDLQDLAVQLRKPDQVRDKDAERGSAGNKMLDSLKAAAQDSEHPEFEQQLLDQLERLKEAAQRSPGPRSASAKGQPAFDSQQHEQQIESFLNRAKSQNTSRGDASPPSDSQETDTDTSRNSSNLQAPSGEDTALSSPQQSQESSDAQLNTSAQPTSQQAGQDIDGDGSHLVTRHAAANSIGSSSSESLYGEETSLNAQHVDQNAQVREGAGRSRSEIIQSSSSDGFAAVEYQEVYSDYFSIVEEVIERDQVPSGYRYYVQRYFQLIRPQN